MLIAKSALLDASLAGYPSLGKAEFFGRLVAVFFMGPVLSRRFSPRR
jgi:hypothetical protein